MMLGNSDSTAMSTRLLHGSLVSKGPSIGLVQPFNIIRSDFMSKVGGGTKPFIAWSFQDEYIYHCPQNPDMAMINRMANATDHSEGDLLILFLIRLSTKQDDCISLDGRTIH